MEYKVDKKHNFLAFKVAFSMANKQQQRWNKGYIISQDHFHSTYSIIIHCIDLNNFSCVMHGDLQEILYTFNAQCIFCIYSVHCRGRGSITFPEFIMTLVSLCSTVVVECLSEVYMGDITPKSNKQCYGVIKLLQNIKLESKERVEIAVKWRAIAKHAPTTKSYKNLTPY